MGKKGGGSDDITINPWAPATPFLEDIISGVHGEMGEGPPGFFPISGVAGMPEFATTGLGMGVDRAMMGNPLIPMAQNAVAGIMSGGGFQNPGFDVLTGMATEMNPASSIALGNIGQAGLPGAGNQGLVDTAGGAFLNIGENPQFQEFQRLATENLMENVLPRSEANFALGGMQGSDAARAAEQDIIEAFGRQIGGAGAQLFGQERGRQQQAQMGLEDLSRGRFQDVMSATGQFGGLMGQDFNRMLGAGQALGQLGLNTNQQLLGAAAGAPGLAAADYADIDRLLGFGGVAQSQAQRELDDLRARFGFGEMGPGSDLGFLTQLTGLGATLGGVGGTQSVPSQGSGKGAALGGIAGSLAPLGIMAAFPQTFGLGSAMPAGGGFGFDFGQNMGALFT